MSTNAGPRRTVLDGLGKPVGNRPVQLWQVPTFFAGVLALLAVALVTPFGQTNNYREVERDLATLRRGLAQPHPDLERLLPLAEDLLNRSQQYPQSVGEIHYLVGTAYMLQADHNSSDGAREIRAQALAHLELAEARGVPAADRNRLFYRLGRVVYLSGGDLQRAIGYMNRGCPLGGDDAFEGYGYLMQAYLKLPSPDLDAALRANQTQIDLSDDDGAVAAARLQRAELLLKKELRSEALKTLDSISKKAPRALQLRAKALQARCCQEDGLYDRAAGFWQELLAEPTVVPGGKGRILYMLGVCYEQHDPPETTQARKAFEEAMAFGGEEAQAAALRLGNSMLGSNQPYTALPHFQFALENVSESMPYKNTLVDRNTVRDMLDRGCLVYRQRRDHMSLQLLAEAYKKIAAPGIAEERQAEAAEELGKDLRERAKLFKGSEAAKYLEYLEKARAQFRLAAQSYEAASQPWGNTDHLPLLAHSADCLVQAQEYRLAEDQLKRLMNENVPLPQQTAACFALAGVYQALKNPKEVEARYLKCIEYNIEPYASRARFQLGLQAIAVGNDEKAKKIFEEALEKGRLPSEEVLVKLAELNLKHGQFDSASVRLKEAISHYPNSPHLLVMRDQLGDCYRKQADQALSEMKKTDPPLPAGKKSYHWDTYRDNLEKAREVYQKLADDLEALAQGRQLTGTEDVLWRKSLFVTADCLAELGNASGEVLRRYEELARRNQNRVEGLMACQRLVSCYYKITEDPLKQQARKVTCAALANALTYLRALPESAFNDQGPTGTKQVWQDWLNYYVKLPTN